MPIGTVKWFNGLRGFGFIQPDDGSRDVFVSIAEAGQPGQTELIVLRKGQKLSYEVVHDKDGKPSAVNVKPS
ncbi:MAG TPA: cold-shock protein [Stellaceae bacterium]|jgi:CspA family cold shock protein|nr:cold-shock protein [Stellaceae bacterium]